MSTVKKTVEKTETELQIEKLQEEVARLKTNPHNFATTRICNGCGVELADGVDRCERHPNEPTNHFREATDSELAERKAKLVLVKQT